MSGARTNDFLMSAPVHVIFNTFQFPNVYLDTLTSDRITINQTNRREELIDWTKYVKVKSLVRPIFTY